MQAALFRVMKALVFRGPRDSPLNELPLSQLQCLYLIGHEEGLKMMDVSLRLENKLPAVSQIVDRLVRRGLVARVPDPHDRRVVRLYPTEQARAMLDHANGYRQARMKATAGYLKVE